MRKCIVFQSLLLLAAVFMTACSDETVSPFKTPPIEGEEGTLTFTLPLLQKKAVSYATASDSENALADLTIYMFSDSPDKSGKLNKVFRTADIDLDDSTGPVRKATINVTGHTGKKLFYFVGNGEGRSADLQDINAGATPEKDFIEAITNAHADTLATPLLMSGKIIVDDVATADDEDTKLEVNLTRRVARIDIENNPAESNFDIKKILVSKAKLRGYVFGDATKDPVKTIETANYTPIEITPKDADSPVRLDSVFYLYPTTIDAGQTEIALEGVFNGETKVYNLKPATPISVDVNKRYILKVKKVDINKAEMELTVADWDDADDETAEPESDLVTFSEIDHSGVEGIVFDGDDTYNLTGVTAAGKLTFKTTSFSNKGTTAEIKYNWGNENTYSGFAINTPEAILTYAASYEQQYEIDIPNINGSNAPVEIEITLRNGANPDQKKVITLYANRYMDTKLYPTLISGTYFAPVNAGVSGPDAKVTDHGLLYQWGRSYIGFTYESGINRTDTIRGPMDASEAETGMGEDKYILGVEATVYDWLTPKDDELWSGAKAQGPCPDGWRVPTKTEFEKIKALYITNYANSSKLLYNGHLEVTGDNGTDILYLTGSGYRGAGGECYYQGIRGFYWASSVFDLKADMMSFTESNLVVGEYRRGYGYSVRCVQDGPSTPPEEGEPVEP